MSRKRAKESPAKKLKLGRDTVRKLGERELRGVAGGTGSNWCPQTVNCDPDPPDAPTNDNCGSFGLTRQHNQVLLRHA